MRSKYSTSTRTSANLTKGGPRAREEQLKINVRVRGPWQRQRALDHARDPACDLGARDHGAIRLPYVMQRERWIGLLEQRARRAEDRPGHPWPPICQFSVDGCNRKGQEHAKDISTGHPRLHSTTRSSHQQTLGCTLETFNQLFGTSTSIGSVPKQCHQTPQTGHQSHRPRHTNRTSTANLFTLIDEYIDKRVDGAGSEIARLVNDKIRDGDVILTYARNNIY